MMQYLRRLLKNHLRLYNGGNFVNIMNISKTVFAKLSLNTSKQTVFV